MSSANIPASVREALELLARTLFRLETHLYRSKIEQQYGDVFALPTPKEKIEKLQSALQQKISAFLALLPAFPKGDTPLSTSLVELIPNWRQAISIFVTGNQFTAAEVLPTLRDQIIKNTRDVSLAKLSPSAVENGSYVLPEQCDGTPLQVSNLYLRGTPYLNLFTQTVPVSIPEDMRAQGTHIIAPPKRGKTTLMRALLANDITRVARGEASIIVIDAKDHPTESLIAPLRRFKYCAPGQAMHDRIVIIDPHPEYPPALNPFDIGRSGDVPVDQQDAFRSHTLDFLEHTFGGMFEFGFTPTQSICFVKAVDVVLAVPKPTFQVLRDVLNDRGRQYLQFLSPEQQRFITEELVKQYRERKGEINARLDHILLRWPTLEKMFNAPTCAFRIGEEMDAGKLIILNTSRARLGEGASMYGRLFINMIRAAAFQRKSDIPVYVYIDECHDYVATDTKLAQILDQCRSFNICPIFAHQRLGQFKVPDVNEAVAQCAIKFANTEENAKELAPRFGLDDPSRLNLSQGQFALRLEGRNTIAVNVPLIELPSMTDKQQDRLTAEMRERYCYHAPRPTAYNRADHDAGPIIDAESHDVSKTKQTIPPEDGDTDPKPWR